MSSSGAQYAVVDHGGPRGLSLDVFTARQDYPKVSIVHTPPHRPRVTVRIALLLHCTQLHIPPRIYPHLTYSTTCIPTARPPSRPRMPTYETVLQDDTDGSEGVSPFITSPPRSEESTPRRLRQCVYVDCQRDVYVERAVSTH